MSIVTFWNSDKEQSGQTLTSVAVATRMAIERNFKILLISTSYNDNTVKNCYWKDSSIKKQLFKGKNNVAAENGIEGLSRLITSNKLEPGIITDYTHVILKNRLEVLSGYFGVPDKTEEENKNDFDRVVKGYPQLLAIANMYYDMVIVDLDRNTNQEVRDEILKISNLNIYVTTQRLSSVNSYLELKDANPQLYEPKNLVVIGKFNSASKYNKKNLGKYLGEKNELAVIPFNTLYFEASEETLVTELFLKLGKIRDTTDVNYIFINEISKIVERIIVRLQELQMKR